jgi:hypothetical protein
VGGDDRGRLDRPHEPQRPDEVARIAAPNADAVAVSAHWLAYARASRGGNSIQLRRLGGGGGRALVSSRREGVSNPALRPGSLLYVRTTRKGDLLKLGRPPFTASGSSSP